MSAYSCTGLGVTSTQGCQRAVTRVPRIYTCSYRLLVRSLAGTFVAAACIFAALSAVAREVLALILVDALCQPQVNQGWQAGVRIGSLENFLSQTGGVLPRPHNLTAPLLAHESPAHELRPSVPHPQRDLNSPLESPFRSYPPSHSMHPDEPRSVHPSLVQDWPRHTATISATVPGLCRRHMELPCRAKSWCGSSLAHLVTLDTLVRTRVVFTDDASLGARIRRALVNVLAASSLNGRVARHAARV